MTRPQYFNPQEKAGRPTREQLAGRPAVLVSTGEFGTRRAQASYVLYDARLCDKKALFSAAAINAFKRKKWSAHHLLELAKGLVHKRPELMTAPREMFVVAMVWQLIASSGVRLSNNTAELMAQLAMHMPISAINKAISLVIRHDFDTELKFNHQFWAKAMPGHKPPKTATERRALLTLHLRGGWRKAAGAALTYVNTANNLARKHKLKDAPSLGLLATGGHAGGGTPRILTQAEILGV